MQADDRAAAAAAAHSVRGMASNVGALALSAAATELETALGRNAATDAQLASFIALIEETLRLLEQWLASRSATADCPAG
ncbi:MAG: Hpt domain-containing protein [Bacillota bacterium]